MGEYYLAEKYWVIEGASASAALNLATAPKALQIAFLVNSDICETHTEP